MFSLHRFRHLASLGVASSSLLFPFTTTCDATVDRTIEINREKAELVLVQVVFRYIFLIATFIFSALDNFWLMYTYYSIRAMFGVHMWEAVGLTYP